MYESTVESFINYCDGYYIATEGLGTAIKNAWNWIVEKIKWIKNKIVEFIKKLFRKSLDESKESGGSGGAASPAAITQQKKEVLHKATSVCNSQESSMGDLKKIEAQVSAVLENDKKRFESNGDTKSVQAVEKVIEELQEVKEETSTAIPSNTQVHVKEEAPKLDVAKVNSIKGKMKGIIAKAQYFTEQAQQAASSGNYKDGILDKNGYIFYVEKNFASLKAAKDNVGKIMTIAVNKNDSAKLKPITDSVVETMDKLNQDAIAQKDKPHTSNNRYYDKKQVKKILMQIDQLANDANGWKPNVEKMASQAEADKDTNLQSAMKAASKFISLATTYLNMVCAAIIGGNAKTPDES